MKEKLFNKLKADGKIPDGMTLEDCTEDFLLKLSSVSAAEPAKPTQLSNEETQEYIEKSVQSRLEALGLDKIDIKHLKLPKWEETLNDADKALLNNPSSMTDADRRRLANKQLKALIAPFKQSGANRVLALNTEGTTTTGGYTLSPEFIAVVSKLLENFGVMRRNANIFRMSRMTANKPKLNAKVTGAYVSETSAKGESNPTFTQLSFTRHDYAFITGISKQLIEDTEVDLVGLLAELAAYDFAKNEDAQCFNGSTLTGYLAGDSAISSVTTDGVASLKNQNFLDMIFKTAYGESQNSKLYLHRTWLSRALGLLDTAGRPLYSLSDQLAIMGQKSFLGYPYELVEVMQPATGNNYLGNADAPQAGDIVAYFGDMRRAATLAIRNDIQILVSDVATVGSNSAFEKNLFFWRFEMAHDFNVEQGGALTKLVLGA